MDILALEDENPRPGDTVFDPTNPARHKKIPEGVEFHKVRRDVMEGGKILTPPPTLEEMADHCADQLKRLPDGSLRLFNPHTYKVSMTEALCDMRARLMEQYEQGG
jgi:nicotinate phosphoribosyltransferase